MGRRASSGRSRQAGCRAVETLAAGEEAGWAAAEPPDPNTGQVSGQILGFPLLPEKQRINQK